MSNDAMDEVFDDIRIERTRQDKKWGGSGHDDEHTHGAWIFYISEHLWRSWHDVAKGSYRKQMVRVAALAVAAIEAYDRAD